MTPEDMDYRISRLLARQYKWGLTAGEQRALQYCYDWLEVYYQKEEVE